MSTIPIASLAPALIATTLYPVGSHTFRPPQVLRVVSHECHDATGGVNVLASFAIDAKAEEWVRKQIHHFATATRGALLDEQPHAARCFAESIYPLVEWLKIRLAARRDVLAAAQLSMAATTAVSCTINGESQRACAALARLSALTGAKE